MVNLSDIAPFSFFFGWLSQIGTSQENFSHVLVGICNGFPVRGLKDNPLPRYEKILAYERKIIPGRQQNSLFAFKIFGYAH